jgi:hypothetical protein
MKRLALLGTLMAVTTIPSTATADKLPDVVSIKADQYNCCTQEIFGSVESPAAKCERNRTIILFYNPSNDTKRGFSFSAVASTTTDTKGEYLFDENNVDKNEAGKRGSSFPPGDYFARVTKAQRGNDVCRRDDSRVITLRDFFVCTSEQAAGEARQKGIFC